MNGPNLDTVTARRAQIASELAGLEKLRAEMVAEDQDLVVAERALKRLASLTPDAGASNVHRMAE
ncbi:MAG TPA: hypothetical protein VHC73_08325 [Vitreimonas sp.]|jgi:hypothetical protein|nr:hypothetical protein [Vitreimonas sp.]